MTDRDKLQQLFDAALHSTEGKTPLARAYPGQRSARPTAEVSGENPVQSSPSMPAPQAFVTAPAPSAFVPLPSAAPLPAAPSSFVPVPPLAVEDSRKTPPPAVLDDAASEELAKVLDEQQARKKSKARRATLVTLLFFLGATGGASAWFVQNPERVQAFKDAMRDIRSVGDVKSLVAKYDKALERIQVRSKQIDQASMAMGIDPTKVDENDDPYMEAEMKSMMGSEANGKAKTVGQRNKLLKEKFGHMEKDHGTAIPKKSDPEVAKANAADGFEWKR